MNYSDYVLTDRWKGIATEVKRRAGWRCQVCNSGLDLNAHHRTYEILGSEEKHMDDLVCLCRRCHALFHGKPLPAEPEKPKQKPPSINPPKRQPVDWEWVDGNVPRGDIIVLTKPLIDRCQTDRKGFTNATLRALGVPFPLRHGWRQRLMGKEVGSHSYRQALAGRWLLE